jgi:hypothetical protein
MLLLNLAIVNPHVSPDPGNMLEACPFEGALRNLANPGREGYTTLLSICGSSV